MGTLNVPRIGEAKKDLWNKNRTAEENRIEQTETTLK